ncbi:MAG: M48 family metallopeptidase [Myxococcales bacterium]|nr:M48 family metallopeptidase [Myxococcales bacterium]
MTDPKTLRTWALVTGCAALVGVACQKVPYTNRKQFNLVPNSIMLGLGKSSYASMLAEVPVQKKGSNNQTLQSVGNRISGVAKRPDYAWEYSLINQDEINAWCLPGGYIGFYTGILPVLDNEAGMAFVMGHEVAHATANHGSERMSQQLTLLGGLTGLELILANETKMKPAQRAAVLGALGVGGQLGVLLPFSRTHESEADVIGMMYMARAGYPPKESQRVWDRMSEHAPNSVPAFLSTHPTNEKRKGVLQEWLPNARKKYQRNKLPHDTLNTLWGG